MDSKKGISGIVTAMILIALVLAATTIVWGVVNNLVKENVENTESCFNTFDKLKINSRYTCYDSSEEEFRFSLSVGDINLTGALVSISNSGSTVSFEITNTARVVDSNLVNYPSGETEVSLPSQNGGKTYTYDMTGLGEPDLIEIAPIVGTTTCSSSDSLSEFDSCSSLIS